MKNPLRSWLALSFLLLVFLAINSGCDLGTYAQRAATSAQDYTPPVVKQQTAPADDKNEEAQKPNDGPDITGNWELDGETTAKAIRRDVHHVVLGGPAGKNKVVRTFKEGRLDFMIKADGTFTVKEVMDGVEAKYRGNWTVNGNQVSLNQTHRGNKSEKDKLAGPVDGDTMYLILPRGPIEIPVVLIKK